VRAQITALEAGDEGAAARWLTPDAQARAALWPTPEARPSLASVAEVARVARWSDPEVIELVRGRAGWQIRRGVLGLAHADSPERALLSFGRAIIVGDWAMVLDLVPAELRGSWTAERLGAALSSGRRAERWRALADALTASRYTLGRADGERVVARVDGAGATEVVVVRDGAGWKVFDVLPRNEYIAP